MQHQNGNPRSLYPGPNRQHTDPHQGSMPSTALRSDQEKCLLLTSPFIEPGNLVSRCTGPDTISATLDYPSSLRPGTPPVVLTPSEGITLVGAVQRVGAYNFNQLIRATMS